jgi:hypothetical protein
MWRPPPAPMARPPGPTDAATIGAQRTGPRPSYPGRSRSPARGNLPTLRRRTRPPSPVPLFPAPGGDPETGTPNPPGQDAPSGNFFQKIIPGK